MRGHICFTLAGHKRKAEAVMQGDPLNTRTWSCGLLVRLDKRAYTAQFNIPAVPPSDGNTQQRAIEQGIKTALRSWGGPWPHAKEVRIELGLA